MKVIGIRGTNGSGKSWVARKIMEFAEEGFKTKHKLDSNKVLVNVFDKFVIPGSYDRACGGCDTIPKPQLVWDTIVECVEYSNVVYEGVIVGCVYEPTMILNERLKLAGHELVNICLDTEFDKCVANITMRRAAEGKGPLERLDNVETNYKKHVSSAKKLKLAGLNVHWVSAEEAVEIALRELGYAQ